MANNDKIFSKHIHPQSKPDNHIQCTQKIKKKKKHFRSLIFLNRTSINYVVKIQEQKIKLKEQTKAL